jgi:protein PhnA
MSHLQTSLRGGFSIQGSRRKKIFWNECYLDFFGASLMKVESVLLARSHSKCELCSSDAGLSVYDVKPNSGPAPETSVLVCDVCAKQLDDSSDPDAGHWRCLSDSMWSEFPAVQVVAYRMLKRFGDQAWAQGLVSQLYLDEEAQKWADAGLSGAGASGSSGQDAGDEEAPPVDSNGTPLAQGDSVTLIKDLDVKGANFTAKRGTLVKNINLTGDPKFVEGKVNGTTIVLVAAYLKKA